LNRHQHPAGCKDNGSPILCSSNQTSFTNTLQVL
jgi:hypothetical protein